MDSERTWTPGGLGPAIPCRISWKDIADWCEFFDYTQDQYHMLDKCIVALDEMVVNHVATKAVADAKAKSK